MTSTLRFDTWQDSNGVTIFNGAGGIAPSGFTASSTITATNASWPVPTLKSPIVKVTVIGGGGGGGGATATTNGGTGGTTTFNAGGAGTVSASGGTGGLHGTQAANGANGTAGNSAGNAGQGAQRFNDAAGTGLPGNGGAVTVAYLNMTGITTVNVTIGAGGTAGAGTQTGGVGGRGEVIFEYVAG